MAGEAGVAGAVGGLGSLLTCLGCSVGGDAATWGTPCWRVPSRHSEPRGPFTPRGFPPSHSQASTLRPLGEKVARPR